MASISSIHSNAFTGLKSLKFLDLSGNYLTKIHPDSLKGLWTLETVDLFENSLVYLDSGVFSNNQNLSRLILSGNQLAFFNQSTFDPVISSLLYIDISHNQIACDCDLMWLVRLVISTPAVNLLQKDKTICGIASLEPLRDKPFLDFNPTELCGFNFYIVCLPSIAVISLIATIMLVYHFRWQLRRWLFLLKLAAFGYMEVRDPRDHDDYEYDLNVIFHEDDEAWVREHLRVVIEKRLPQFNRKVYGDADLVAGMHYLEAVDYAVTRSYKTVVVLSRAAIKDRWFMLKFRTAIDHVTDTQTEFVLLLFLEDILGEELPFLVRLCLSDGRPYVHWPEDIRGREYFFDELTARLTVNLKTNDLIPNE
ncbi:leucine-rich repeat and immunoglobulin-like domain-containing nogo receptor-interacting protein 2 [Lytechinus variegatus]|uniref:leucine-rich repeat and immunoglobulin-like domain-containing nogo receptor-interacting protein 2 n=1 Tax=Lytechinus variegatus TaxID=7654 RepID=UPI001BB2773B|nr:leucine-rich repeat and immunoglobulin-like domain-containing nogo receptor-interacting protein 2 [Lytechinus variegatus]